MLLALANCYQRTIDVEMVFVWCLLGCNVQMVGNDQVQVKRMKLHSRDKQNVALLRYTWNVSILTTFETFHMETFQLWLIWNVLFWNVSIPTSFETFHFETFQLWPLLKRFILKRFNSDLIWDVSFWNVSVETFQLWPIWNVTIEAVKMKRFKMGHNWNVSTETFQKRS